MAKYKIYKIITDISHAELGEITYGKYIGRFNSAKTQPFILIECPECKNKRWTPYNAKVSPKRCKMCHIKIMLQVRDEILKETHSYNWKGGRTSQGYKWIYIRHNSPFLAMANSNHAIPEHRLVMAQFLGRCLHPWEVVHHKNHIRDDNKIENLELMQVDTHRLITILESKIQYQEKRITRLESRVTQLEAENILLGATPALKEVAHVQ